MLACSMNRLSSGLGWMAGDGESTSKIGAGIRHQPSLVVSADAESVSTVSTLSLAPTLLAAGCKATGVALSVRAELHLGARCDCEGRSVREAEIRHAAEARSRVSKALD